MSRPRLNRCLQGPLSLCQVLRREREKTTNMFLVQDPGFTLESTVTSAMWFSAHVVLNRTELLCSVRSTLCHMKLMPPQNTTHFLCMRHDLLNLSRTFSNSRKLDFVLHRIDHCTRLVVINPRHCVRHDNFSFCVNFLEFPTVLSSTSHCALHFLSANSHDAHVPSTWD